MCGIVGYIGKRNAVPILMEGLQRLEYRGYDSAGIAVSHDGALRVNKCQGRVRDLQGKLAARFKGSPGIAHTRWATHGEPSDRNAHPHCDTAQKIRRHPQRHHRECRGVAHAAAGRRRGVSFGYGFRGSRPSDRVHARRISRRRSPRCAANGGGNLWSRGAGCGPARVPGGRTQRESGRARDRRA